MPVAKNSVFKIGTAGTPGTAVDISTSVKSVKFPREADEQESTTFQGNGSKAFLVGLLSATISVEGNYSTSVDAQLAALLGVDGVAFEYGPEGSTTGMSKYTGLCILTKYEPPSQVGQLLTFTAEFRITGAVTRAAY